MMFIYGYDGPELHLDSGIRSIIISNKNIMDNYHGLGYRMPADILHRTQDIFHDKSPFSDGGGGYALSLNSIYQRVYDIELVI